jgi:uncharacterized membrane protein YhaH (DUF805 family)
MSWVQVFFSGKGRIRRRDFWIATLLLTIIAAPLALLGPLGALLRLAFVFPNVCLLAKRLHDAGRNGWLASAPYLATLIAAFGIGLASPEDGSDPAPLVGITGALVIIAAVIFWFRWALAKGDPGPNRYGERQDSFLSRRDRETETIGLG